MAEWRENAHAMPRWQILLNKQTLDDNEILVYVAQSVRRWITEL